MQVAIVGGGIAGLATAYFLQEKARAQGRAVNYTLIEGEPSLGGKIQSARENGFVVEGGPDSFITNKLAAIELCRELGLGDRLIRTNDAARKVFVWSRGALRPMPEGVMLIIPTRLMPFVRSPLISWPGKLRMGLDALIPARRDGRDESLAHFVRRRLGNEALDRIAEPMIAGIYVADAEYLSLKSTFPRFIDMEMKYGGLLRGVLAQKRAARKASCQAKPSNGNGHSNGNGNGKSDTTMFMTLRGGLSELIETLTDRLDPGSIMTGRPAVDVCPDADGHGYQLTLHDGTRLSADAVVFATPTYATANLLQDVDAALAAQLRSIRYVSTATVSLGFRRSDLEQGLDGFGFVVPRSEKRRVLACTYSSTKFDGRAPEGHVLLRAFVGGAHAEHLAELDDEVLEKMVRGELWSMMGIRARPVLSKVYRWHKANPQYDVGHAERVAQIEQLASAHRGIYLTGAAYRGVGIPDCVENGAHIADQLLQDKEEYSSRGYTVPVSQG